MFFPEIQAACGRRAEFKFRGDRISGISSGVVSLCSNTQIGVHSMLMSSIQTDREKQKHQEACSL